MNDGDEPNCYYFNVPLRFYGPEDDVLKYGHHGVEIHLVFEFGHVTCDLGTVISLFFSLATFLMMGNLHRKSR